MMEQDIKKFKKVKILIVDDYPLLRESLINVLNENKDFEVIGEAGNGEQALKLTKELHPDLVLMDITMPDMDGLEATRQIKKSCPNTVVLVLTIHSEEAYILGIMQAGANGYLIKNIYGEEVVRSIRSAMAGEMILSPTAGYQILKYAPNYLSKPVPLLNGEQLTIKDIRMLQMIARGRNNKDISTQMGISIRTVKGCLSNIFSKLNAHSRGEAVANALSMDIISVKDIR